MIGLLYVLLGAILTASLGWWAVESQREAHEEVVQFLTEELCEARKQARAYLGILCPSTLKPEGAQPVPVVPAQAPAVVSRPAVLNRRMPFKLRFKQNMKETNTKQGRIDVIAAALATQGEKQHA
jgi:hypothetical protein